MHIHKIVIPTPYPIGDVNVFLVKGDVLSLFDVGPKTHHAFEALKAGIEEAGYMMEDIEQIVLTHHHPDHAGWVDAFPNARIIGHKYVDYFLRKDFEFLEYREAFYRLHFIQQAAPLEFIEQTLSNRRDLKYFGTLPLTDFLNDGDEVPGHPGLKTIYTPGHAQSHFIFWDELSNTVIGGDLLLESVASNPLLEPPIDLSFERPKTIIQYQKSLNLLRDLKVEKVYAGHGNDITHVNDLIDMRFERDQMRTTQLLNLLNEPKTLYEITKEFYNPVYKTQLALTLSKTVGYLDILEEQGLVKSQLIDEVFLYSKI